MLALRGIVILAVLPLAAQDRYALFLDDAPMSERALRSELVTRNFLVTGASKTLLHAIFVTVPKERVNELKSLPGVKGVVALWRRRLNLNRATTLVNAPAAWSALGGAQ